MKKNLDSILRDIAVQKEVQQKSKIRKSSVESDEQVIKAPNLSNRVPISPKDYAVLSTFMSSGNIFKYAYIRPAVSPEAAQTGQTLSEMMAARIESNINDVRRSAQGDPSSISAWLNDRHYVEYSIDAQSIRTEMRHNEEEAPEEEELPGLNQLLDPSLFDRSRRISRSTPEIEADIRNHE